MIADFVREVKSGKLKVISGFHISEGLADQELAVWYNDNVIYPDKVSLNCYYYRHYSFWKDIEMIIATVLGRKVKFAEEEV